MTFHPLGDLFVVYNHDLLHEFLASDARLGTSIGGRGAFASNELLVKVQYAFRY